MRAGNRVLAVQRRRDRHAELLRERDELVAGAGGAHAAAGDDHRPLRRLQRGQRRPHRRALGLGPERRHVRELRLDKRGHLRLLLVDLAFVPAELEMHRAGGAGHRHAECLPHHVGESLDGVDGGVPLRHRLERRHVVHFLVHLPELGARLASAGERDHRRVREVRVAQARGEVERADDLRHAHARPPRRARVAVGHVRGGLLAVRVDPPDARAPLHLGERAPQHRRHHEHVRHAVAGEHVGEHLRPGHLFHGVRLPSRPAAIIS
jgi:hypothetical protein